MNRENQSGLRQTMRLRLKPVELWFGLTVGCPGYRCRNSQMRAVFDFTPCPIWLFTKFPGNLIIDQISQGVMGAGVYRAIHAVRDNNEGFY